MQQSRLFRAPLIALLALAAGPAARPVAAAEVSSLRLTPIVRAVKSAAPAVVNIQGQKMVAGEAGQRSGPMREVSGMGTGVVIDPRGYILTNHHVVDGVRQINVTLSDRRHYIATLVAHDSRTDLAVIRVQAGRQLETIPVGSSGDLMTGEPVIAIGNAYGYEHTVTRGIISQLHRDVQVSDTQAYDDLIQTDASINPGNSGGPLLSIEGKMIGLNVAVRAGAQGIGFAIPVDAALEVAAELVSIERLENKWHGMETASRRDDQGSLVVERVTGGGPAAASGLKPGDVIQAVGGVETHRRLDVELALLGKSVGDTIPVKVVRNNETMQLNLMLASRSNRNVTPASRERDQRTWELLGLELNEEPKSTFASQNTRYRGGMRVVDVRPDGPAARQGIRKGDILVGMHRWETASARDVRYIVTQPNLAAMGRVKFYILRNGETLFGHLAFNSSASRR